MSDINIDAVLAQMRALQSQLVQKPPSAESTVDFAALLERSIDAVNTKQQQAASLAEAFEQGEEVPLAEVMVSLQKARVSFQAMIQVRNKLVEAYKDIMNMQM